LSRSRLQADLDWSVCSPALIRIPDDPLTWPDDDWYASLAVPSASGSLPQPPHSHHFRLGLHFEKLLAHWLDLNSQFRLRDANLQVFDHKRTVGEFDFLVEQRNKGC